MPGSGKVRAGKPVLSTVNAEALELQIVEHVGEDVAVVFDDQDAHSSLSLSKALTLFYITLMRLTGSTKNCGVFIQQGSDDACVASCSTSLSSLVFAVQLDEPLKPM